MKRLTLLKRSILWGLCAWGATQSGQGQTMERTTPSAFMPSPVTVSSRIDTVADRVFRVHIVESGHTLYSIARTYQVGRGEIIKNSLGDTVRVGEVLYIPYGRLQDVLPGLHPDSLYTGERPAALPARPPKALDSATAVPAESKAEPKAEDEPVAVAQPLFKDENHTDTSGYTSAVAEAVLPAETDATPDMPADTTDWMADSLLSFADTIALTDTFAFTDSIATSSAPLRFVWGQDTLVLADTTTAKVWYDLFQSLRGKDSLSVAMLLPLYLQDTSDTPVKSYAYLPFLEGWMTAHGEQQLNTSQDSLPFSIRYRVWDVTDKFESVDRALNDPDLQQADFLIAAVYTKVFDTIRRFAQSHCIPLLHPLTEQDSMAVGLPYFVQCLPAYETQAAAKAAFLLREFPPARYRYLIFDDSTAFFRKRANQLYDCLTADTTTEGHLYRYSFGAARLGQMKTAFDSLFSRGNACPTVFIGCSDKEIALLNVLIALRKSDSTATGKIFIGPSNWMTFTKIEPEYFKNLRLICYQPFYWDKTGDASLQFERHYYRHFGVLPSDLAYKGYTCYRWFTEMLRNETVMADPFSRNRWRIRPTGGWANTRLFWLELIDHAFALWPLAEPEDEETYVPNWLPEESIENKVNADDIPAEELDDTTDKRESRRHRNRKNID